MSRTKLLVFADPLESGDESNASSGRSSDEAARSVAMASYLEAYSSKVNRVVAISSNNKRRDLSVDPSSDTIDIESPALLSPDSRKFAEAALAKDARRSARIELPLQPSNVADKPITAHLRAKQLDGRARANSTETFKLKTPDTPGKARGPAPPLVPLVSPPNAFPAKSPVQRVSFDEGDMDSASVPEPPSGSRPSITTHHLPPHTKTALIHAYSAFATDGAFPDALRSVAAELPSPVLIALTRLSSTATGGGRSAPQPVKVRDAASLRLAAAAQARKDAEGSSFNVFSDSAGSEEEEGEEGKGSEAPSTPRMIPHMRCRSDAGVSGSAEPFHTSEFTSPTTQEPPASVSSRPPASSIRTTPLKQRHSRRHSTGSSLELVLAGGDTMVSPAAAEPLNSGPSLRIFSKTRLLDDPVPTMEHLAYKIDTLRWHCERKLGRDVFQKVYAYLRSVDMNDDDLGSPPLTSPGGIPRSTAPLMQSSAGASMAASIAAHLASPTLANVHARGWFGASASVSPGPPQQHADDGGVPILLASLGPDNMARLQLLLGLEERLAQLHDKLIADTLAEDGTPIHGTPTPGQ
jgi:hypothetical protein